MTGGLSLMVLGVWFICQVTKGGLISKLGL